MGSNHDRSGRSTTETPTSKADARRDLDDAVGRVGVFLSGGLVRRAWIGRAKGFVYNRLQLQLQLQLQREREREQDPARRRNSRFLLPA